jgi:hypothetical protein
MRPTVRRIVNATVSENLELFKTEDYEIIFRT